MDVKIMLVSVNVSFLYQGVDQLAPWEQVKIVPSTWMVELLQESRPNVEQTWNGFMAYCWNMTYPGSWFLIYGRISTNNLRQEPGWFLESGQMSRQFPKISLGIILGWTVQLTEKKNVTAPIEIDHFKMTNQATNANVRALMPGYERLIHDHPN